MHLIVVLCWEGKFGTWAKWKCTRNDEYVSASLSLSRGSKFVCKWLNYIKEKENNLKISRVSFFILLNHSFHSIFVEYFVLCPFTSLTTLVFSMKNRKTSNYYYYDYFEARVKDVVCVFLAWKGVPQQEVG